MFIHSRCCLAHWELTWDPKAEKYALVCEQCGKDSGVTVVHDAPLHECEFCKDKNRQSRNKETG